MSIIDTTFVGTKPSHLTFIVGRLAARINGCLFTSPVPLLAEEVFWLKDGRIRMYNEIKPKSINGKQYIMQSLVFRKTNFSNAGFYQCGIFVKRRMSKLILSSTIRVSVTGK